METKNPPEFVAEKLDPLNFASSLHERRGGGGSLFWNSCVNLNVLSTCDNYIDVEVSYKKKNFFATFTYGAPELQQQRQVLQSLTNLGIARTQPWFLTSDFNAIIDNSEKEGGTIRTEGSFVDFRTFMSQCDLFDLRHSGNFLSLRGTRYTHTVHCRLDRAISNSTWAEEFPTGRCSYLAFEGSDHRQLISYFEPDTKKRRVLFRYDQKLCKNEEVKKLIGEVWNQHHRSPIKQKITACRQPISKWNKHHHENSQAKIREGKNRLEQAMSSSNTNEALIAEINKELRMAYKEEEDYWRQRSRTLWLALGDKNSGFSTLQQE